MFVSRNSSEIVPEEKGKDGKIKQPSAAKHWCFTLNNWTNDEYNDILKWMEETSSKYVIGFEIGEKEKTPHLQGHIEFGKKKRFSEIQKFNIRLRWSKARNVKASKIYCMKDDDFVTNYKFPRKIKFPEFNKDWQVDIMNIIKEEPDDRTIYWFWENVGGIGKTTFVKYLVLEQDGILVPSKKSDAFHAIAKKVEAEIPIDLIIYDVPRTSLNFINYGSIEKVKDGCFVSGKYEGCECVYACPTVIIFANAPPETTSMSLDRWVIKEIGQDNNVACGGIC